MNLWIATQNRHKLKEISEILGPDAILKSLLDLPNFPEILETGETFRENATIKARTLWDQVQEPVLADDSGLEVDALGGRPGVRSMRYSEPDPTYEKNIDKLLMELKDIPIAGRSARFRCAVVFFDKNGRDHAFEGVVEGAITFERRGKGGFGYDPVFFVTELNQTLAELDQEEKNSISHRGRAIMRLKRFLKFSKILKK